MIKVLQSIFVAVLAVLALPSLVFGQTLNIPESPQSLIIKYAPQYSRAGQSVKVSVESFSIDLERSQISWFLNGQPHTTGRGLKSIDVTAPTDNSSLSVTAQATPDSGVTISRSVIIRTGSVDMLWEAYSYTPPFYKGKGLVSHETLIKVVAMPELRTSGGALLNTDNLVYKWSKGGTVLGSLSGIGKKELIFRMPKLSETETIEVEVSSSDGTIKSKGRITYRSRDPEALLYKKDPLLGIDFSKTLAGDVALAGNEINLVAYPYFFSQESPSGGKLKYNWTINRFGTKILTNEIVLSPREGAVGASLVAFKVDNLKEILQSASKNIGIIFGAEESTANPFF